MTIKANREIIKDVIRIMVDVDYNYNKIFIIALSKVNEIYTKRIIPIEDVYEIYEKEAEEYQVRPSEEDESGLTAYQLYLILLGYITEHTDKDNRHDVEDALLELYKLAKEESEDKKSCDNCKHNTESWDSDACDGCCGANSKWSGDSYPGEFEAMERQGRLDAVIPEQEMTDAINIMNMCKHSTKSLEDYIINSSNDFLEMIKAENEDNK